MQAAYGLLQDANSYNALHRHEMLPHNNGANRQGTCHSSGVPTSGPPSSTGIPSFGFNVPSNPYVPTPYPAISPARQNHYIPRHSGSGPIRRHVRPNGWRQHAGSGQYHREGQYAPGQYQQPSVLQSQIRPQAGLSGPGVPGPDEPLRSIEQEITQPPSSAADPDQPDETTQSEPGQSRPSTPGPSQPLAEAPSANNELGQFDPMHETHVLGIIKVRFWDWLIQFWSRVNPTEETADDKFDAYWIEQLNLNGDGAQVGNRHSHYATT